MKVLITGGAGMLGHALIRAFRKAENFEVTSLTRKEVDLMDKSALGRTLSSIRPELVVHAAAKVGGIQANINQPVEFLVDNLQMDSNLITACIKQEVPNLLYIGSSCMYPKDYRQPLVEGDILQGGLEPTNEGYALAKIVGSKLCEYASESLGCNYKTIIPSNLYGPGDNFNPGSSHMMASIIKKVHDAKMSGAREIEVWGSGDARREFTFIDDLASWMIQIATRVHQLPPLLNVGIGKDHSVNEFYNYAMEQIGFTARLKHNLSKPEGMKAKLLDSSLARSDFGWNPKTSVDEGIRITYDWYLEAVSGGII